MRCLHNRWRMVMGRENVWCHNIITLLSPHDDDHDDYYDHDHDVEIMMLRCHNIIALLSPPHVFALCNKASGDGLGTYFCHDWPVFIVLCSFYFPIVPEGLDFYDFSCWMKVFDIWWKKVQWKREKFSLMVIGETELCWECEKVLFGKTSKSPVFY